MSHPSWIGQTLSGRYRIEALLGQGGMSAVYRASDPNLKRVVAIKLIHSHLSNDKEFVHRFQEEAAAIASLRHPNIIQVYDFNTDGDVNYMVLEFVHGETLLDRLQRLSSTGSTIPIEDAIHYCINICDALSYAHHRGMIHRDIKPANIMINDEDQAILMDFGIVKIVGGTSHTASGAVLGTARYISPEVIRSEPADQRSDIYSLGITLYEMLSGRTPFQSDSTLTLLMMHLNDPVPDPRTLRQDIPASMVQLLLKTLEKDRANRYANAAELTADLQSILKSLKNGTLQAQKSAVKAQVEASAKPPQKPVDHPAIVTPQPRPNTAPLGISPTRKTNPWLWLAGLGIGFLFLFLAIGTAGVFWASRQFAFPPPSSTTEIIPPTQTLEPTSPPTQIPTSVATQTPRPISTIAATLPSSPVAVEPTLTLPIYYVRILSIVRRGSQYEVQYETTGFTEKLPWMHVHFFFNTVPPEQAGKPGSGPWILYGGPRPFSGYAINQTPEGATQMCALVANPDHTIILGSGNCYDLPKE